jgi:hypothetical protein
VIDNLFGKVDHIVGDKTFVICGDIIHDRNTLDAFVVQLFTKLIKGLASRKSSSSKATMIIILHMPTLKLLTTSWAL